MLSSTSYIFLPDDFPMVDLHVDAMATCKHPLVGSSEPVCAPRVFVGGAMKCGTNEAMKMLSLHSQARFNTCTELTTDCTAEKYQGRRFSDGSYNIWESIHLPEQANADAIASRLPTTDGVNTVTFDKTPGYLETHNHPSIPQQMKKMMPGTKIVFTVCDPAERLYSEFNHLKRVGVEKLSEHIATPKEFPDFVQIMNQTAAICSTAGEECHQVSERHLKKGSYAMNIRKWLQTYSQEDILVINMGDDRRENTKKLLQFAGLEESSYAWSHLRGPPAFKNTEYGGRQEAWKLFNEEMQLLSLYYSDSNKDLATVLGIDFPNEWKSTQKQPDRAGSAN